MKKSLTNHSLLPKKPRLNLTIFLNTKPYPCIWANTREKNHLFTQTTPQPTSRRPDTHT